MGSFLNAEVPSETQERYALLTKSEFDKQIQESPRDARYFLFYGTFLRGIGDIDGAIKINEKAVELSPNKQTVLFEYGATLIQKKDYQMAYEVFKRAYELEPSYNDAKLFYAISAFYLKNDDIANELIKDLPRSMVLYDDRLIGVFVDLSRYEDIISILTSRIAEGSDELQNNISLSVSYLRTGQRQKSIDVLRSFLIRKPEFKDQIEPYITKIQNGEDF
jgi:tetratricopeptide (TPR) repeat protein